MKSKDAVTVIIILGVLLLAYFIINNEHPETSEEIAKCIGENSVLYTQLGCHYCEIQKDMFGDNYKSLNVVDCFYEHERCLKEIEKIATPSWKIDEKVYLGVQSIERLKELTGC
jgi:hypothetical protein